MVKLFLKKYKEYSLKICLLGDPAVGKTTLKTQFLGKTVSGQYRTTVGVDFAIKYYLIQDKYYVKFQIWDIAGQETYSSLRPSFYKGAKGILMLFDITRAETFQSIPKWLQQLWQLEGPLPMILIGNKADLREQGMGQVLPEQAMTYARMLTQSIGFDVPYLETSALTGYHVSKSFELLALSIIKKFGRT